MSTERVTVRRHAERAAYDRATIDTILDEGLVAHVGFVCEGTPFVIPISYGRFGDTIYLHGSNVSRTLGALSSGADFCLTVTLLDALVLARSTFHHSMNYRSVVLFGKGRLVTDPQEKKRALECIVEHIVPGRTRETRGPSERELAATSVIALAIDEASAKTRSEPPVDAPEDLPSATWAGVLPIAQCYGPPVSDEFVPEGVEIPSGIARYARPGASR
jgi:nitroimidazol reductase NimA-like FMN-containing flavoprotein (pyridoxamine 5'-phosphate oxidase superfamily)